MHGSGVPDEKSSRGGVSYLKDGESPASAGLRITITLSHRFQLCISTTRQSAVSIVASLVMKIAKNCWVEFVMKIANA
jgi:hypothetical protein